MARYGKGEPIVSAEAYPLPRPALTRFSAHAGAGAAVATLQAGDFRYHIE
jgi:hypothetical protein